jgi:hypothetical protein
MHRACGITSVNEASVLPLLKAWPELFRRQSDIPEKWRAAALSKIRKLSDEQVSINIYSALTV